MRFSFIIPYYDRAWQFRQALESIKETHFPTYEVEIVIIEDAKSTPEQNLELKKVIFDNNFYFNFRLITMKRVFYNPSLMFNEGVKASRGDYLIITNPEIVHRVDILGMLNRQFNIKPNAYVICSCVNVLKIDNKQNPVEFGKWYQHSVYRPLCYHFCSSISRKLYDQIGGFDERFSNGVGYDDNAFRDRIFSNGIEFIQRDDLLTYHLPHDRSYTLSREEYVKLTEKNKKLYEQNYGGIWKNGKYRNQKYN